MKKSIHILVFLFFCIINASAQHFVRGKVELKGEKIEDGGLIKFTNEDTTFDISYGRNGRFEIGPIQNKPFKVLIFYPTYRSIQKSYHSITEDLSLFIELVPLTEELNEIVIISADTNQGFGLLPMKSVEDFTINDAKTTAQIDLTESIINRSTNNPRQIFSKLAGLTIWESDGAGLQLGIGGRGLSPNRTANFNTRQNGVDISADALGYPESYYIPPSEALQKIQVIRGASSLQYGTQFGGLLNFVMKSGHSTKPFHLLSRQTLGSFGLFNSFNSIGGQKGKVNYYGVFQHKKGNDWRPNSDFNYNFAYGAIRYEPNERLLFDLNITHMNYVAHQPGGLLDSDFNIDPRQSKRKRNWFEVVWTPFAFNIEYSFSDRTKINFRNFGLVAKRRTVGNLGRINQVDDLKERDVYADNYFNYGNETRFIHQYNLTKERSTLLLGFRYYKGFTKRKVGKGSSNFDADFKFNNPENLETGGYEFPGSNQSFFAENIFQLTKRWSITPGFRYEHIVTNLDGYNRILITDAAQNIIVDSTDFITDNRPRDLYLLGVGASYRLNPKTTLYFNISQNYRAVNFSDIVAQNNLFVDPNLQDESGLNLDIGIKTTWKKYINFNLTSYVLSYKDRIGILPGIPNERTNIGDALIYGAESLTEFSLFNIFNSSLKDSSRLFLFVNFGYTNGKYVRTIDENFEGNELENVPPYMLKLGINFTHKAFRCAAQWSYINQQFSDATNAISSSSAVEGIIPSYHVTDLSLSYTFSKNLKIEGGVNNLTNSIYFTRRATGYPGPGIIPSSGRNVYLTLQLEL